MLGHRATWSAIQVSGELVPSTPTSTASTSRPTKVNPSTLSVRLDAEQITKVSTKETHEASAKRTASPPGYACNPCGRFTWALATTAESQRATTSAPTKVSPAAIRSSREYHRGTGSTSA